MNLIVIHKNSSDGGGEGLLPFALASEPLARVVLDGLSRCLHRSGGLDFGETAIAIPEGWRFGSGADAGPSEVERRPAEHTQSNVTFYGEGVPVASELAAEVRRKKLLSSWFAISNGRFATQVNAGLLESALTGIRADVLAVNVDPDLPGEREKVRLTAEGRVAGFRRVYSDWAEFTFTGGDWPHHLFVRHHVLSHVVAGNALPASFSAFAERCRSEGLTLRGIVVCGNALDLGTEDGLLSFCRTELARYRNSRLGDSGKISGNPRIVGKVLLGENISAGSDVIIIGPAVIGDRVRIETGAIIHSSIIGPGSCVPRDRLVRGCVVEGPQHNWSRSTSSQSGHSGRASRTSRDLSSPQDVYNPFRTWGRLSYARCLKRITDCIVAVAVLTLFAPVIPFVALAIKLTSSGPVFYKDKRQGLHGREFDCLKFRTMITGAHEIQQKLRAVSQVDGPQFKMTDDPRINTVGRFLRETYIDEIPQFVNVLLGQMSVVGPRPSPESENTLCPLWRDARLSVRPGITGLWQIFRTREPMRDFQEWIHYDIKYVRNLSLKTDLWLCWRTTKKLLDNFISQF
ncbi:MAG: sugar transferase [Phycisphaerales bacterium]|nr:MAG: sugar transferase [Phycisphaerales bacterium]